MKHLADEKPLKGIRLYVLFLLRITLNWHFLFKGITKLILFPGFSRKLVLPSVLCL